MTANLNKAHSASTMPWVTQVLAEERPALLFGQELRVSQAQALASSSGYQLIAPRTNPRWWMGSWILVRDDLTIDEDAHEYWGRFECYVASGYVTLPDVGQVRVISAHASPNRVTTDDLSVWGKDLPVARTGPTDRPNALRYSDMVLYAIGTCASAGPVLAAGDFNESRNYQQPLGAQFFDRAQQMGLIDVTYSRWEVEKTTHFDPRHPELQVDHVFASPSIDRLIVDQPWLDPLWINPSRHVERSDHAPVWFKLTTSPRRATSSGSATAQLSTVRSPGRS